MSLISNLYFMPIIFGVLALCFVLLGARGLLSKKPFIVSSRKMLLITALGLLPQFIMIGSMFFDGRERRTSFDYFPLIMLLFWVVMGIFLWMQSQGYTVFGIREESFRSSLHDALDRLEIPFEERLSKVVLLDSNAELKVTAQGRMGVATLNIKPRTERARLQRIIAAMREDFTSGTVGINMATCYFYVSFGLLMFALSAGFYSMNREHKREMQEIERKYPSQASGDN